jgi:hypothetical protein
MIIFLGEYQQNLCQAANKSCDPCPERLPSCIGKSDGLNPFPTKMWQADYIKCYKNRTMEVTKCPTGKYFNPRLNQCMKIVQPGQCIYYQVYKKSLQLNTVKLAYATVTIWTK